VWGIAADVSVVRGVLWRVCFCGVGQGAVLGLCVTTDCVRGWCVLSNAMVTSAWGGWVGW